MGLNYLIPAALLPYLVRILGVEQYGLIAFAQAIAQYFVIATDYGFNFSATRAIAQNRDNKLEVSRIFWTVTTIKLLLLLIGAVVIGVMTVWIPRMHANLGVYFAAYIGVAGNAFFPTWLFQGMERMRSISIITGIARLASAGMVILFVHHRTDTVMATLLLSCGFLVAGILGMIAALRNYVNGFVVPSRKDIYTCLRDGRHLFLTTAAVSLYSNTNTFLVGMLAGNAQVGYFSLADKLIRAITGLFAPVIQAAYPQIIRLIEQSKIMALALIRKTMLWSAGIGLVAGLALYITAKPIALIAFGHNAAEVIPMLRWLSLFPALAATSYSLSTLALIPFGFDRSQSQMLLTIGAVNVLIGLSFIPHFGAIGGVVAMSVIESLQIVGGIWLLARGGVAIFCSTWNIKPAD